MPQFSGGSGSIPESVYSFPLANAGEDPLHSGTVVGNLMKCEQAQHAVRDTEYYVTNDQETGRFFVNFVISKRAMRESDLLACISPFSSQIPVQWALMQTARLVG